MAMRRPRIKAAANLVNIKRKPKAAVVEPNADVIKKDNQEDSAPLTVHSEKENLKDANPEETCRFANCTGNINNATSLENNESHVSTKEIVSPASEVILPTTNEIAFKQPTKKENNRQTSVMPLGSPFHNYGSNANNKSDVSHSDIDSNIMQMNLQRTINGFPMSPTKQQQTRPRIRPSPIIGQRRNSYVGCSPSPHNAGEESSNEFIIPSLRRVRYNSTSLSFVNSGASPHKYMPMMNPRMRTDSNCSAFSDILSSTQSFTNPLMLTKMRKPTTNEVSNNRTNWLKDYESRCPNGVPDKTRLKMMDLIYYNPTTNPMDIKPNNNNNSNNNIIENTKIEESSAKKEISVAPVPQLKLNANNELVLDDKSLEIETTAEQEAKKLLANTSLLFVDENTGTNGFYRRQKRTREWSHDETIRFYRCLQTVGTDFSLMVQLFPLRNRRDLKLKFKKEERNNAALINKAILYPKNFNIDVLKEQLEADDRKREEELRKWREIDAKAVAKVQKLKVKNISERALQNGVDIYENENVPKKQMSSRAKKTIQKKQNEILEKQLSEETNKALKNQVEKPLVTRKEQKEKLIPKSKKPRCEKELVNTERDKKLTKSQMKKIKLEKNVENNITIDDEIDKQLECELDELLQIDDVQQQQEHEQEISETQMGKTIMDLDNGQAIRILSQDEYQPQGKSENISQMKTDTDTFFNITEVRTLDNFPKEFMSEGEIVLPLEETAKSTEAERITKDDLSMKIDIDENPDNDADEEDTILRIMQQIEEGGLMLVSSIDPNNLDNLINEIYMIDKNTGDLCAQPLNLPEDIVQSIVELAT